MKKDLNLTFLNKKFKICLVKKKSLSVLIPLYNKESLITLTINEVQKLLKGIDYEIIIIENESTDRSEVIVKKYISESSLNIRMHKTKKGLGNALKAGIDLAKKDYIICIPSDFSTGTSEIDYFNLSSNFEYVITNRYDINSVVKQKFNRKFISFVFNNLKIFLLNLKISDTQFSFIIRNDIAKNIARSCHSGGFFITTELIYFAIKSGVKITEIPVQLHEQENNKSTVKIFKDSFEILIDLIRLFTREGRIKNYEYNKGRIKYIW